jgi:hypothetical protein
MAGKVQSFKYEIQTKGKAFYHFRHAEISKKILQEIFVLRKMRHLLNYSGKFYVSKSKFQD